MKLVVVYRSNSEHGRKTEDFIHELSRRYPEIKVEAQNIDGREGYATAMLYDIVRYPGIVAARDDGTMSMLWQGEDIPMVDEVAGYLH